MKNLILAIIPLFLLLCGCEGFKENSLSLNDAVEKSYDYLFEATDYLNNYNLQHRKDAIELKKIANAFTEDIKNEIVAKKFEDYVAFILQSYGNINHFQLNTRINENQIKVFEYIAINEIIKNYYLDVYDFDKIRIKVIPENKKLKVGEMFKAEIVLAVDNIHSPYIIVVDNDTILPDERVQYFFLKPAEFKGKKNYRGELMINHRGQLHKFPFGVTYEVE